MAAATLNGRLSYLEGGGETGALIRAHDWSETPLGPPEGWPAALRTAVSLMLGSRGPVYVAWGPELISLYNDGYLPIVGTKHPDGIGQPFSTLWAEIWEDFRPIVEATMTGEAQHFVDLPIALAGRPGLPVGYFTFSYTALRDETGEPAGFYCAATETTEKVLGERNLRESEERLRAFVTASSDVIYRMSADWTEMRQLDGRGFLSDTPDPSDAWLANYIHPADQVQVIAAIQDAIRTKGRFELEHRVRRADGTLGWTLSRAVPLLGEDGEIVEWFGAAADVTERRRGEELRAAQSRILELAVQDGPLHRTLEDIARTAEELSATGVLASVLLLDADGLRLRHGAAPSLPAAYNEAIDGIAIGPGVGSCGSAVHAGTPVYVADIATDPLWADFRELALAHGLRACWSIPILSPSQGTVLGTFAMYYREPRAPNPADLQLVDFVVRSAALVIERKLAEQRLRESETRYRQIVEGAEDFAIVSLDEHGVITGWNNGAERMIGYAEAEALGQPGEMIFTPEDRAAGVPEHEMNRAVADRRAVNERWHQRKDGSRFWGSGLMMRLDVAEGGYLKIFRDRTAEHEAEAALRQSEARLRSVVQAAPFPIMLHAEDGEVLELSRKWTELTGYARDEIGTHSDWFRLAYPDRVAELEALVAKEFGREGEIAAGEYAVRTKDGSVRIWDFHNVGVGRTPDGRRLQISAAADVTDRKAAEEAFAAKAEEFENLADNISQFAWSADVTGSIYWYNKRWYDYTGTSFDAMQGWGWTKVHHPDHLQRVLDRFRAAIEAGEVWEDLFPLRGADGEYRWFLSRARPIRDEEGRIVRWFGTNTDITEQRLIEARLRESEAELQRMNQTLESQVEERTQERDRLWESSQDLLLFARHDSIILAANPAWTEVLGWTEAELVGASFMEFIHPDDVPASQAEAARLSESGRSVMQFENRYRTKDDRWVWLSWAVTSQNGVFYAVARDVTQAKQRQAELESAQEALRQSQKMEAIGQLTGGIAHDFNNLLGAVVGSFDLIRRKPDDVERVRRYAEAGMQAAERGAKLTGQLLAFSRAQRIEMKPLVVSALVTDMRDMLDRALGPMVPLLFDLEAEGAVLSDPTQLEMAVLNLAINARDAMPAGGTLTIATRRRSITGDTELAAGDYVEIAVKDTGAGMPADVIARAFDPFFTTKGIGKGTGLGLSQVYGVARQTGGGVRIDSEVGVGTTVRILLPETSAPVSKGVNSGAVGMPGAEAGATILIVDDDPDVRRMLVDSIGSLGYRVVEAEDGPSGLRELEQSTPDLMMVDFAMPGMNGAEVARAAREQWPDLPIVFASGYADTAAIESVAGADAIVLRKPFLLNELQAVLVNALLTE